MGDTDPDREEEFTDHLQDNDPDRAATAWVTLCLIVAVLLVTIAVEALL